ncbi:MAG: HIT domain-containing protein [Desulfovibrionaceae bacterium]|nr:HIT domain-containing protein [Desulfovibrionaceae bacterium]
MKNLWAPWRMDYILGPKPDSCVLCVPETPDRPEWDAEHLVVYRGHLVFVMLNRYPYASGHLMVIPYRHVTDITELTPEESGELLSVTQLACRVLREASRPQGINIGINLGEAAGAGIRDHMHLHVVPRWNGDSSFMAVLDDARVIPEHLMVTQKRFASLFAAWGGQASPLSG